MTPSHARYAVCAFVLLSAGVAANIMLFQEHAGRFQYRTGSERVRKSPTPAVEPPPLASPQTNPTMVLNSMAPVKPKAPTDPVAAAAGEAPDVIASIQRELQARGYEPGTPDGVAGAVTRAAIMAWEHDHGLSPTGEPTEAVMKAIVLGISSQSAGLITAQWQALPKDKRARPEQMLRTVQQQLSGLGYNLGKVTGRMNEDTERAIREFETDQNLAPSGRISGPLVARLAKLAGAGRPPAPR